MEARDRIEGLHLRLREHPVEHVRVRPLVIHRDGRGRQPEPSEGGQHVRVGRHFDGDLVARLGKEAERQGNALARSVTEHVLLRRVPDPEAPEALGHRSPQLEVAFR